MSKPTRAKKTSIPSEKHQAVPVAAVPHTRNVLPLTPSAEIAAQSAVRFLHPSHCVGMSLDEYHDAVNLILEQACLAIVNHKATGTMTYEQKKGRKKRTMHFCAAASDCWPPAFDLREETEDERFARVVLASH